MSFQYKIYKIYENIYIFQYIIKYKNSFISKMFPLSIFFLTTTFLSYGFGWYLLILYNEIYWSKEFLFGFLLLIHSLIYSAYYYHELAHSVVTRNKKLDNILGIIIGWLNGSCYFSYYELQWQHLEHHRNKRDIIMVPRTSMLYTNKKLSSIVWWLEYFYVPAWHLAVGFRAILSPWWKKCRRNYQCYTLSVIFIRALLFTLLMIYEKYHAFTAYTIAYCIMIHVSRIADIFGHLYEVVPVGTPAEPEESKKDKKYDMDHTFSIYDMSPYFSKHWQSICNAVLFLNFSYHNAHHFSPLTPWYLLPEVNTKFDAIIPEKRFSLNFWDILRQYHIYRTDRLDINSTPGEPIWDPTQNKMNLSKFIGEAEASMLVVEV